jgi:hypothetical protein
MEPNGVLDALAAPLPHYRGDRDHSTKEDRQLSGPRVGLTLL